MADEQNFLDSPWTQIGVPLAATIATAIAPRHAGRAAAIGLGAYNVLSDQRMQQKRLSAVLGEQEQKKQLEQQRLADSDLLFDTYSKADDTPPDASAPEGGDAPRVDMTAKNQALEQGKVPKPTFAIPVERAQMYKALSRVIGPEETGKMFAQDVTSYTKAHPEFDPAEIAAHIAAVSGINIPVGGKVNNLPLPGGGSYDYETPKPEKPPTPTPYLDAREGVPPEKLPQFARDWNRKDHPDQIIYGSDGQAYWADPRTHAISPMRLSGAIGPAPGQAPQPAPAQSGQSTPVGPTGQPPTPGPAPAPQQGQSAPVAAGTPTPGGTVPPLSFSRSSGTGTLKDSEVADNGEAIIRGEQPPKTAGFGRAGAGKIRAYLARRGYNLAVADLDFDATKRFMATANGPQQLRMRQAINNAYHQVDVIEGLAKEWAQVAPQSGFRQLNRATLAIAVNTPGRTGAVAQALLGQINDLTSELANVYMGGNAPTDHSMKIAAQNLRGDFNEDQFAKAFPLIRTNLKIRDNSMKAVGAAMVSPNSPYGHQDTDLATPGAAPAPPEAPLKPGERPPLDSFYRKQ